MFSAVLESRREPVDSRLPMVIELLDRGEYSPESLRSDEEYGDGGSCSEG